jgi:hypothetical protein
LTGLPLGNFWVDVTRAVLWVLLPPAVAGPVVLRGLNGRELPDRAREGPEVLDRLGAVREPSTTAPVASSTVKSTMVAEMNTVT